MFGAMWLRNKYLDKPGVKGLMRDAPRVEEKHGGLKCPAVGTGDVERLWHL